MPDEFYENGALKASCPMRDGKLHGMVKTFREDGTPISFIPFYDGLLEGHAEFFDEAGHLLQTAEYEGGQQNGETVIHSIGIVRLRMPMKAGTPSGLAKFYDEEGVLIRSLTFLDGVQQGPATEYYPSGKPKTVTAYIAGKRHGEMKEYSESGRVLKRQCFDKDKPVRCPGRFWS